MKEKRKTSRYLARALPIRVRDEDRERAETARAAHAREAGHEISHSQFYLALLAAWERSRQGKRREGR